MKIIVISFLPEQKFSSRQHLGFMRRLSKYFDYEYISGSEIFNRKLTAQEVFRIYKPDVVIHYDSHAPKGKRTMFSSDYFASFPCAKVMIEVDFWKKAKGEKNELKSLWGGLDWYVSNKFDLVIRRGCYEGVDNVYGIPSVWLPFSASNEFHPGNGERKGVIGFAGALNYRGIITGDVTGYWQRVDAINRLKEVNLLEHCRTCRTLQGSTKVYPKFLRSVVAGLTSAETRSPFGKVFEIMVSGTILLTPDFDHKKALFGDKECFVEYTSENIVDQAKRIINNPDWARRVAENGVEVIKKYHTSEKRILELKEHLENLLKGKSIINRWEI